MGITVASTASKSGLPLMTTQIIPSITQAVMPIRRWLPSKNASLSSNQMQSASATQNT